MTANLTSLRHNLPVFRALWTRVGIRATAEGTTRVDILRTLLSEGLDTWDRLDAGKRRPRKTVMRKPKTTTGRFATNAPNVTEVDRLTETAR